WGPAPGRTCRKLVASPPRALTRAPAWRKAGPRGSRTAPRNASAQLLIRLTASIHWRFRALGFIPTERLNLNRVLQELWQHALQGLGYADSSGTPLLDGENNAAADRWGGAPLTQGLESALDVAELMGGPLSDDGVLFRVRLEVSRATLGVAAEHALERVYRIRGVERAE